jgi:pyrroloquinoline quinone biosynthesis protein E
MPGAIVAEQPDGIRAVNFRPYALLAELTYQCPLHCPYCSNPTRYPSGEELSTEEWKRVFGEASQLGVLHLGLSGGEPLARHDLAGLVAAAREAGLYTNLITSAVGLDQKRIEELRQAGLDSVQISFQAGEASLGDEIAGARVHQRKLEAARLVREAGLPLSLNVVLHRRNIDDLEKIIALAEMLNAVRLELANVQYYGWGYLNRIHLLPTRNQVETAAAVATAAKERLAGQMEVLYVLPDYYETHPKACMQGWGRRYLTVNPVGNVLPCPNATSIEKLKFENVREQSLAWIWNESASFNRFRGTEWMPLPCRECPRREIDFGGCRCQAALLTGDARTTDPVCALSPDRGVIDRLLSTVENEAAPAEGWTARRNPLVENLS